MEQESKQEEVTKEPVGEETPTPVSTVTSTEVKETSGKTRTEKEFTSIQSLKDKADARAIKAETLANSTQTQIQELRDGIERQRLAARQKELSDAKDDPDMLSAIQKKHILDDREEAMDRKWNKAMELAGTYGFASIADVLKADTPKEMELMAKLKAQSQTTEQEKEEPQALAKETETTGFTPDSNLSDAGGDSDEAFQKRWNDGDEPATKENLARARKILEK